MSGLAEMLAELGGLGRADLRGIEYELALAQRATAYTRRSQVQWGRHFPWLKGRLSEAQNHRCCWCGKKMDMDGPDDDRPTFEHIIPLSKGGEDTPANLAIACYRCNQNRGNDEWWPGAGQGIAASSASPPPDSDSSTSV